MPKYFSDGRIVAAIKTTNNLECLLGSRPKTYIAHKVLSLPADQFDYLSAFYRPVINVPFITSLGRNYVKTYKINPDLVYRNVYTILKRINEPHFLSMFEKYERIVDKSAPLTKKIIETVTFDKVKILREYNHYLVTTNVLECIEKIYEIHAKDVENSRRASLYINDYELLSWRCYSVIDIPSQLLLKLCKVVDRVQLEKWVSDLLRGYSLRTATARKQINFKLTLLFTLDNTSAILRSSLQNNNSSLVYVYLAIRNRGTMKKMPTQLHNMLLHNTKHWT